MSTLNYYNQKTQAPKFKHSSSDLKIKNKYRNKNKEI